jgi:hypothetical protein
MLAEVRAIIPNDIPLRDWPSWTPADPSEEFRWFTVDIGPAGDPGADSFQVAVASPRGLRRSGAVGKDRALVVRQFVPEEVERAIREFVSVCEAYTWADIVNLLRTRMDWEYEGYR